MPSAVPGLDDDLRAVLERYLVAFKRADLEALEALASADYLDDAGTAGPDDDITRAGLVSALAARPRVQIEELSVSYVRVRREGIRILVDVQLVLEMIHSGRRLRHEDSAQLVLRAEPDGYRFLSGM